MAPRAKKAGAAKPSTQKQSSRTTGPKRTAAKKTATKKGAAKSSSKKSAAKKTATKKGAARKTAATAKKTAAKKKPANETGAKRRAAEAPARAPATKAKRTTAKRSAAKRAPARTGAVGAPKLRVVATEKQKVRAAGSSAAVDAYVASLESWQRQVIAALRRLIRRAAPEAVETIKWGQPVFEDGGPFAYLRPAGSHITFGFWRGAELDDPAGVLEGSGDRMRHVKLHDAGDIDATLLEPFVRQAVTLNRRHGNPAAIRRV